MPEANFDVGRWQAALAHQRPLLALAERLLADPARADEAVGHALLQESLGARAESKPALPFLRAVVRNFARRVRRDEAVRQRYEAVAREAELAPAAVDLAAREQLRRRVAEAVLGLDEPYRTTVALVYLEEVPVAVAATQLGVAEATVRVRLHRAREELRRRLDREFGSRGAWALVLGWGKPSLAAPVGVFGVVVGGIVMKKVFAVVVVAVLLLSGGSFWWWNQAEPASLPQQAQAQVVAANVVSPPPAAAPVRESAGQEPVEATKAAPIALSQHFRCVDEQGQPVANAEVRLVRLPWGSGVPDLVAHSDAEGKVVIDEVVAANYVIRAREGLRHHVPHFDRPYEALPRAPLDLLLCELWIGGLVMPGAEVMSHGCSYGAFQSSRDGEVEKELVAVWSAKHPGAVLRAMFRSPSQARSDTISMQVEWYGHVRHEQPLRMWPASQFQGPEVVDPATVPTCDWASPRIVLVDAVGATLPDALQAALRERADLHGLAPARRGAVLRFYTFRSGAARLPTGDYELRLCDARNSQMVPAARCTVARDTTELRIPITIADRVVRLHLRGLPNAGYMLRIVHESGRTAQEFGSTDGDHTLLLPPGPCIVTCKQMLADGRQNSRERAITITDAVEQEVTWDLAEPPAKR